MTVFTQIQLYSLAADSALAFRDYNGACLSHRCNAYESWHPTIAATTKNPTMAAATKKKSTFFYQFIPSNWDNIPATKCYE
jgi:hypothetical protein